MKTLNRNSDKDSFIDRFKELNNSSSSIILWQVLESGRVILNAKFLGFNEDDNLLKFNFEQSKKFINNIDIYFYSQDLSFIFKSTLNKINQNLIELDIPSEIKVLDEDEISEFEDNFDLTSSTFTNGDNTIIKNITEDLSMEMMTHDSEREHINSEYDVSESTVDHLEHVDLSGHQDGTDSIGTTMDGFATTENIRAHNHGHGATDKMSSSLGGKISSHEKINTSMVGKGKTEHQNTRVDAKGKTEHTSTKEYTKSLKDEQSAHDKKIFEDELSFISLDDEDKKFADKRDAPRARPQKGKMVFMRVKGESSTDESFELFDLSRGGLGVICFEETRFSKEDTIEILAFDKNKLDSPMLAIVRSVRPADETETSFKIGMQFLN